MNGKLFCNRREASTILFFDDASAVLAPAHNSLDDGIPHHL
jgi:hypothetical protein